MLLPPSTTLSRGPAFVTFGGAKFFTKADIVLDAGIKTNDLQSSAYGTLGKYPTKVAPTLKVPLLGDLTNLSILFPYGATLVGASIFGESPSLVITPLDTTQPTVTLYQAAVFEEPEMTLGPGGPALGDVTFRFRPVPGAPLTDAAAWYSTSENTWDGSGFNVADLIIQSYAASWLSGGTWTITVGADTTGALAWDATAADVETALNDLASVTAAGNVTVTGNFQEGFTVAVGGDGAGDNLTFTGAFTGMPGGMSLTQTNQQSYVEGTTPLITLLTLDPWAQFGTEDAIKIKTSPRIEESPSSQTGFDDLIFQGTSATVSMIPKGVPQAALLEVMNIQGPNAGLGTNLAFQNAHDLTVNAPGLYVEVYGVSLNKVGAVWSSKAQRVPSLTFDSGISISSGIGAKYYVGASAPE